MNNVKFTHKITLMSPPREGSTFMCAIIGHRVYVGPFTDVDGEEWGEYEEYDADSEHERLTPELWYDDPMRWTVKKLNQFKGNK